MTDSAIRVFAPRLTATARSKRARRFWASMGAALRQSSRQFAEHYGEPRRAIAVRVVTYDARAWRGR